MKRIIMTGLLAMCGVAGAQPQQGISNIKMQDGIVYGDIDFGHTKDKLGTDCKGQYFQVFEEKLANSIKLRTSPYQKRHAALASTVGVLCSHKASHEAPLRPYAFFPEAAYSKHHHKAHDENGNFLFYYWLATRGSYARPTPYFGDHHHRLHMNPYGKSYTSKSHRSKSRSHVGGISRRSGGFRRNR